MFTRQHLNAIAKDIRTELEPLVPAYQGGANSAKIDALVKLALRFAKRFVDERNFKLDSPNFDPLQFLDACSPDAEKYPLSELWEAYNK